MGVGERRQGGLRFDKNHLLNNREVAFLEGQCVCVL